MIYAAFYDILYILGGLCIIHLKQITNKGVCRLYLYETYYDKDPETGKGRTRSRMIESLGRLDELQKKYDDPAAHFKQVAAEKTLENKQNKTVSIAIDTTQKLAKNEDNLKNVGYGIFKELYKELELDKFWNWKCSNLSLDYSIDKIFPPYKKIIERAYLDRCILPTP